MRKMMKAAAAMGLLTSAPTIAQSVGEHGATLTTQEIREIAVGKTTFGTFADRPISYAVYVSPDGRMIGRLNDGQTERLETGTWRIENDRLIGQWDDLKGGDANAFAYVRVGENVHAIRDDGSLDRVQFFVDGDPLGLADTDNRSDVDTVRNFVSQWSAAWSPGDAAESWDYDATVGPLYADDVLAFDMTEDITVIRGKADHKALWQPFMRGFDRWRFTVLPESIAIDESADRAHATMFVDIEGFRADGERFFAPAQATLFLKRQGDSWQIAHEHISLPRVTE